MAQWWIFLIIVMSFFGALIVMILRSRGASRAGSPMLRAKTIILDDEYSLAFAFEMQRTSDGGYSYLLKTALEGMRQKVYGEDELLDLNKHLNVIGDQVYITRKLVLKLADKVDVAAMEGEIRVLKAGLDEWQTRAKLAGANKDAEVEKSISNAERLGKAYRPTKSKGAM